MNSEIRKLLESVRSGETSVDDAMLELKKAPFEDIGYAKVDLHRKVRQGAAEVIYGAGKTPEQIGGIIDAMRANGQTRVLITRMSPEAAAYVGSTRELDYHKDARVGIVGGLPQPDGIGKVVIATGGTSDIPVAEEAALTAQVLGSEVVRLYDVGVSGVHRLLAHMDSIMEASVVIAIAGMEGALASVVGGMVACPVIAVPTSVGYGASFGGVAALLAMLNSCASGVSVVNIDNGFGAGYQAHMIERAGSQHGEGEPDMKTLRWNLAENATRNQLLGDTLLQLPPDSRQRLEAAADAAGVPDCHHHDIGEVLATIDGLVVSPAVRDHMRAIYTILAEAEAAAHGCAVEQTHFHEVGDGSRIRNTLLVCLAVEATGAKRIVATVAQTGQGEVECAHGTLSIPAPATSAIIARGIPVSERTLPGERMTPTSAAMILHFVDEFE